MYLSNNVLAGMRRIICELLYKLHLHHLQDIIGKLLRINLKVVWNGTQLACNKLYITEHVHKLN